MAESYLKRFERPITSRVPFSPVVFTILKSSKRRWGKPSFSTGVFMDSGKVFVLILTALAFGILAYLELKSRRSRQEAEPAAPQAEEQKKEVSRRR